jgi:WD40 repeat protein
MLYDLRCSDPVRTIGLNNMWRLCSKQLFSVRALQCLGHAFMNRFRIGVALTLMVASLCILIFYFFNNIVQAPRIANINATKISKTPDRIWFTPQGQLVSAVVSNNSLQLEVFQASGLVSETLSDPSAMAIGICLGQKNENLQEDSSLQGSFPYAVSEDGKVLAFVCGGSLYSKQLPKSADGLPGRFVAELRKVPVASLAFFGDTLAVIFSDGKLEVWSILQKRAGIAGSWLSSPWQPWPSHSLLGLSSFESGDVGSLRIFKSAGIEAKFWRLPFSDGSALAQDSKNMVIGKNDGIIYILNKDTNTQHAVFLPSSRPVRAVALGEDDSVLAAGDFPDIFFIKDNNVSSVVHVPSGVTRLVAREGKIAYVSGDYLSVGQITYGLQLASSSTASVGIIAFAVLSILTSALLLASALPRSRELIKPDDEPIERGDGLEIEVIDAKTTSRDQ